MYCMKLLGSDINVIYFFFLTERDARTLFVKNLPYSITQDELKEVFDQAIEVRIPMDNNGSSRG